ncbi:MAG: hypothetical protein JO112_18180 [Planctomycetes bacterium]|nr:hypothetical protein [Planctomycetota bacterium]
MALDDLVEPEVGVAMAVTAAVTAAVASEPVRKAMRRGAVYGLAGLLIAGDKIAALARGVAQSAQQAAAGTSAAPEANRSPSSTPQPTAG